MEVVQQVIPIVTIYIYETFQLPLQVTLLTTQDLLKSSVVSAVYNIPSINRALITVYITTLQESWYKSSNRRIFSERSDQLSCTTVYAYSTTYIDQYMPCFFALTSTSITVS